MYYGTEQIKVQFHIEEMHMQEIFNIYCKTEDSKLLTELLRDGMEVRTIQSSTTGYATLSVIPKKKRGRKKQIALTSSEINSAYKAGTPVTEISKKAGCTERYIWKLLREERDKQAYERN